MEIVFGTATRSGSEFLIRFSRVLLGRLPEPYAAITPGRKETILKLSGKSLHDYRMEHDPCRYFSDNGIKSVKLEEPCQDTLGFDLAAAFPNAKWLSTIRKIEDIVTSHFNIEWGWSEEKVLQAYLNLIHLLEQLASENRLFVVNIDAPEQFNLQAMAGYLECEVNQKAVRWAENWYLTNDLSHVQRRAGQRVEKRIPESLGTLRQRHKWIPEIEQRYLDVWRQTSSPVSN